MLRRSPYPTGRPLRTIGYLVVLALLALSLGIEGSQPAHTHDAGTPALFNAECSLATLAAFHGTSPLPDSPQVARVAAAVAAPLVVPSEPYSAAPVRHTDSRAPPAPLA
jgi:hypothetical protein